MLLEASCDGWRMLPALPPSGMFGHKPMRNLNARAVMLCGTPDDVGAGCRCVAHVLNRLTSCALRVVAVILC